MTGQEIIKRYNSMGDYARGNWEQLWQECADWCWPLNDNINRVRTPGEEKPPQRMIDDCIEANYNFASGFFSHMFPPNTVWAKFRHPDPTMMAIPAVADYFERVSRNVHQLLIGSNFAQEEFQALLAMGCFGTNCLSVEEDKEKVVRFRNFVVGNVHLDVNHLGEVDTGGREFELGPRQAVQQFGLKVLKEKGLEQIVYDAENGKNSKYKFIHLVCPRMEYDKTKKDIKNKPFASYYVCKENGEIVKESGYDINPYKTGRFSVGNDEIYGRGPMSMLLSTARRTNVIYRDMLISAEEHAKPRWLIPDDDSTKFGRYYIKYRATNPNGKPERLQPNGEPTTSFEMYKLHGEQIRRGFFNPLFRPLEDKQNMTAWEAQERSTTDMMTLAPFVSRYLEEHVSPVMNHVFYIMQKRNLLPQIPQELADSPDYEIDFVGRLSLATKSFETMGAINTLRIFGEIGQIAPQMMQTVDNVDPDKLFKEVWYSNSSSMNALKPIEEVEKERATQAEAAAKQQMVDNLAPVADAVQKVSGKVDPESILAQG
jgi:hypothetical protein